MRHNVVLLVGKIFLQTDLLLWPAEPVVMAILSDKEMLMHFDLWHPGEFDRIYDTSFMWCLTSVPISQ
ncbi:unnamed protein product [Linum trigynum]|uniref:Uncharacterized protein n=1 Tax=Linum trigynum TaxID=586398 RepID=A0AAV2G9I2_9ROSI